MSECRSVIPVALGEGGGCAVQGPVPVADDPSPLMCTYFGITCILYMDNFQTCNITNDGFNSYVIVLYISI